MPFNSWQFAAFFLITFFFYYLPIVRRFQLAILIGASLFFYFQGAGGLTILLLVSILVNALVSYGISGLPALSRLRTILSLSGIGLNLLVLCCFKYAGLFLNSFGSFLPPICLNAVRTLAAIPLPLGISFYCLGSISLIADRTKGTFSKEPGVHEALRDTAVFISFFPHLISGPILRAGQFFPQIGEKRFREIDWYTGFKWIILGYFLKVFVADNLASLTWFLNFPYFLQIGAMDDLLLLYAYSAQIFADFAGYSLIALGLAKLFGYSIINNFNAPYIAASLREFWRRWHISLSTWMRDYLFIPLGGSRCSRARASLNTLIVMALAGLWHGASWTFAIWGVLHGIALVMERQLLSKLVLPPTAICWLAKVLVTLTFVSFTWVCFILHDLGHVQLLIQHLCADVSRPVDTNRFWLVLLFGLPVFLMHLVQLAKEQNKLQNVLGHPYFRISALGTMIFLAIINPGPPHAFIYFQF